MGDVHAESVAYGKELIRSICNEIDKCRTDAMNGSYDDKICYFKTMIHSDLVRTNERLGAKEGIKQSGIGRIAAVVKGGKPLPSNYHQIAMKSFCKASYAYASTVMRSDGPKEWEKQMSRSIGYVTDAASKVVTDPVTLMLESPWYDLIALCSEQDTAMKDLLDGIASCKAIPNAGYTLQMCYLSVYEQIYRPAHDGICSMMSVYCTDEGRNHELAERVLCSQSVSGYGSGARSDLRDIRNSIAHPTRDPGKPGTVPVTVGRVDKDISIGSLADLVWGMTLKASIGSMMVQTFLDLEAYRRVFGSRE